MTRRLKKAHAKKRLRRARLKWRLRVAKKTMERIFSPMGKFHEELVARGLQPRMIGNLSDPDDLSLTYPFGILFDLSDGSRKEVSYIVEPGAPPPWSQACIAKLRELVDEEFGR